MKCTSIGINEMVPVRGKLKLVESRLSDSNEWIKLWQYEDGGLILESNGDPVWEDEDGFWESLEEYGFKYK